VAFDAIGSCKEFLSLATLAFAPELDPSRKDFARAMEAAACDYEKGGHSSLLVRNAIYAYDVLSMGK
jgi:hypothetical protein